MFVEGLAVKWGPPGLNRPLRTRGGEINAQQSRNMAVL
jgi:hypothetical protein